MAVVGVACTKKQTAVVIEVRLGENWKELEAAAALRHATGGMNQHQRTWVAGSAAQGWEVAGWVVADLERGKEGVAVG